MEDPGILVIFASDLTRVRLASLRFVPCPEWYLQDGTTIGNEAGHVNAHYWPGYLNRLLDHQPADAGSEVLLVPSGVGQGYGVRQAVSLLLDDLRANGLTGRVISLPSPDLQPVQEPGAGSPPRREPGVTGMHELTVACPTDQLDSVLQFRYATPGVLFTRHIPPLHANPPTTPPAPPKDTEFAWLPDLRQLRLAVQVPLLHTGTVGHHDLEVYCDGGASPNPGRGGAAIIWNDHGLGWSPDNLTDVTNNEMELVAAIGALQLCRTLGPDLPARLKVTADSQYVVTGITSWIHGWKRKGWRRSGGGPVENQRLWATLDAERLELEQAGVTVEFSWVRGHAGQQANERADRLATRARQSGQVERE